MSEIGHVGEGFDHPGGWHEYRTWVILLCPSCRKPTVEEIFASTDDWSPDMDSLPCRVTTLYPTSQATSEGLPLSVRPAYQAALRLRNIDANAFAVSVGRFLETVCAERGAQGGTLVEKLEDLRRKEEIPGRLAEMAHKLRLVRNVGAHADRGEVAPRDVPLLLNFCESIIDYIYRAPAKLEAIEKSLTRAKTGE
jgi:hypothetical protein